MVRRGVSRHFQLLLLAVLLVAVLLATLALKKYQTCNTRTYDLAIYDQMIWGITVGNYFSSVRDIHVFAHHVQPVLFVLAALYRLGAGPGFLLAFQAAALALAAVPLYFLARDRLGSARQALLWACLLFLYPPFQYLGLADFHPGVLAVPLIFAALLFFYRERFGWQWFCLVAAVACQENIALTFAGWGLAVLLGRGYSPAQKRSGLAMALAWLAYFALVILVIKPHFAGSATDTHFKYFNQYGDSYGELAETVLLSPGRVIADVMTVPKMHYLFQLGAPLLLLMLVRPLLLLPALPILIINLLSNHPGTIAIQYHFSFSIIPFIFAAALEGYHAVRAHSGRLADWCRTHWRLVLYGSRAPAVEPTAHADPALLVRFVNAGLLLACLAAYGAWSPLPGGGGYTAEQYQDDQNSLAYREIASLIPAAASVSAPIPLTPHLSHRSNLYLYPSARDPECDFVVVDMSLPPLLDSPSRIAELQLQRINNIRFLQQRGYQSEAFTDTIFLLRKPAHDPPRPSVSTL